MNRITLILKTGTTAYNVKLGQPLHFLRLVPVGTNMVGVVLLVDSATPADPCNYYVLANGPSGLATDTPLGKYLGFANGLDVFSPCFV